MIYAIIENAIVVNVVEAEETTAFSVIFPNAKDFVRFTTESGSPVIGLSCKNGKFQAYPSWLFDLKSQSWKAPKPKPAGEAYWDESQLSWIVVELAETESPT